MSAKATAGNAISDAVSVQTNNPRGTLNTLHQCIERVRMSGAPALTSG